MAQNIYDDPAFFEGYAKLPRSAGGLEAAAEWPAIQAMLPDLMGRRVLDLGCGYGWFARWAREAGADAVLALDLSERMLARAREMTSDPAIAYERADLETLALPDAAFDLAYSSLALHYVVGLEALLATVHRAVRPGGWLVFSCEHPLFTAPGRPGWSVDGEGRRTWPLDRYLDEGPRRTDWIAAGVIKQHRSLATYLTLVIQAGFTLAHVEEWGPSAAQIAAHPDWAKERDRPPFLLVAARR